MARSTDGGATWTITAELNIVQGGACSTAQAGRGIFCINAGGSSFRSRSHPIMGISPTDPSHVYMVYSGGDLESAYTCAGSTGFHSDTLFRRSTDGGATWTAPAKINTDPQGKDQYYPWMSVLPNGQIWVGWNDRRDDANNFLSKWYQAHSNDEGTTWLDINNAPGNDVVADVQTQPSTFIGDYHGLGAGGQGNGNVLGMWFDSRNSPAGDAYTDLLAGGGATPTPSPTITPTPTPTPTPGACSWGPGADLPSVGTRFAGAFFPANGKFYAMGGRSSDTAGNEFTHPFEDDPATNSWTTKSATYPDIQVNNIACGVLNDSGTDFIYCVGGSDVASQTGTGRVFRYDPVADVITTLTGAEWPPGNSFILPGGFTVLNNKFYILGGFDIPNGVGIADIWEFTPGTNAWVQKVSLPVPLGYIPAAAIGSVIYTGGGADITGGVLTDTTNSFVFDPVANTIGTIADIPRANEQHAWA